MIEYVIGYLFDGKGNVALINKKRPSWQVGRINGIGGHIEIGETPEIAMVREFKEEAGCDGLDWRKFCVVKGNEYKLHLFSAHSFFADIESKTDEKVGWYQVNHLPINILPNLTWMIPMANYRLPIMAEVIHESPEC